MRPETIKDYGDQIAEKTAEPEGITVRDFHQGGASTPRRHWLRGDPFATAFFNALSAVFPKGEAFMVSSMAAWRGKLSPEMDALKEVVLTSMNLRRLLEGL
jgi:predicted metal-dependent hydrolase